MLGLTGFGGRRFYTVGGFGGFLAGPRAMGGQAAEYREVDASVLGAIGGAIVRNSRLGIGVTGNHDAGGGNSGAGQ